MTRGGKREGSGRPKGSNEYGETTKSVRIPLSRVKDVLEIIKKPRTEFPPLYNCKVCAGFPSPADDYIETYLDLNEYLIKSPASTFFLRVQGDSMKNASIHSGDILIVDRSVAPLHGKIVIAAINGELTVKRLYKKNQEIKLQPENSGYQEITITEEQNLMIWGVVTHIIHQAL